MKLSRLTYALLVMLLSLGCASAPYESEEMKVWRARIKYDKEHRGPTRSAYPERAGAGGAVHSYRPAPAPYLNSSEFLHRESISRGNHISRQIQTYQLMQWNLFNPY